MLIPHDTHIMVVDGSRMALFINKGPIQQPRLELLETETHKVPATSAMGTDRPGRSHQSVGQHRSSTQETDLHQQEEATFARKAGDRLASLLKQEDAKAILVADPRVLGFVRERLERVEPAAQQRLVSAIPKNYAGLDADDIAELLSDYNT